MYYQNLFGDDDSCDLMSATWPVQDLTHPLLFFTPPQDSISPSPMNIPFEDPFISNLLGDPSELEPQSTEEHVGDFQNEVNDTSMDQSLPPPPSPQPPGIIITTPNDLGGQHFTESQVDFASDMSPAYTEATTVSRAEISPIPCQRDDDIIMTAPSTPAQASHLLSPSSRPRQPRSRRCRNRPRPAAPFKVQSVITAIRHNFEASFGAHVDAGLKFITLDRFMAAMETWTYPKPLAGRLRREVVQEAVQSEMGLIPTSEGAVWLELLRRQVQKWALSKRVSERRDRNRLSDLDSPFAA